MAPSIRTTLCCVVWYYGVSIQKRLPPVDLWKVTPEPAPSDAYAQYIYMQEHDSAMPSITQAAVPTSTLTASAISMAIEASTAAIRASVQYILSNPFGTALMLVLALVFAVALIITLYPLLCFFGRPVVHSQPSRTTKRQTKWYALRNFILLLLPLSLAIWCPCRLVKAPAKFFVVLALAFVLFCLFLGMNQLLYDAFAQEALQQEFNQSSTSLGTQRTACAISIFHERALRRLQRLAQGSYRALQSRNEALQQGLDQAGASFDIEQSRNRVLRQNLDQTNHDLTSQRHARSAAGSRICVLQQNLAQANADLTSERTDRLAAESRERTVQGELKDAKEQIATLKMAVTTSNDRRVAAEAAHAHQQLAASDSRQAALQEKQSLEQRLAATVTTVSTVEASLAEMTKTLAETTSREATLKHELSQVQSTLSRQTAALAEADSKLAKSAAVEKDLRNEIEALEHDKKLKQYYAGLDSEKAKKLEDAFADKDHALRDCQEQKRRLEDALASSGGGQNGGDGSSRGDTSSDGGQNGGGSSSGNANSQKAAAQDAAAEDDASQLNTPQEKASPSDSNGAGSSGHTPADETPADGTAKAELAPCTGEGPASFNSQDPAVPPRAESSDESSDSTSSNVPKPDSQPRRHGPRRASWKNTRATECKEIGLKCEALTLATQQHAKFLEIWDAPELWRRGSVFNMRKIALHLKATVSLLETDPEAALRTVPFEKSNFWTQKAIRDLNGSSLTANAAPFIGYSGPPRRQATTQGFTATTGLRGDATSFVGAFHHQFQAVGALGLTAAPFSASTTVSALAAPLPASSPAAQVLAAPTLTPLAPTLSVATKPTLMVSAPIVAPLPVPTQPAQRFIFGTSPKPNNSANPTRVLVSKHAGTAEEVQASYTRMTYKRDGDNAAKLAHQKELTVLAKAEEEAKKADSEFNVALAGELKVQATSQPARTSVRSEDSRVALPRTPINAASDATAPTTASVQPDPAKPPRGFLLQQSKHASSAPDE